MGACTTGAAVWLVSRDYAERVRGITAPEIVAGVTAHPALDKACHYLKVKLVKVDVPASTQMYATTCTHESMRPVRAIPVR